MKKILLILVTSVFVSGLWGEPIETKTVFVISPTTGIFTGTRIGVGQANIYEKHSSEMIFNYKIDLLYNRELEFIEKGMHNLNIQWNRFYDPERKGSFLIVKGGLMWFQFGEGIDPGGGGRNKTRTFPLASICTLFVSFSPIKRYTCNK